MDAIDNECIDETIDNLFNMEPTIDEFYTRVCDDNIERYAPVCTGLGSHTSLVFEV